MISNEESLKALFDPESITVVGASRTPGKVGHDIFVNILQGGYEGTLYPVNPTAMSVCCVRCYKTIQDIPDSIDLAIVILPPNKALAAIESAIAKGVKAIVIVSAGFKEVGGDGAEMERQIVEKCQAVGVRLVGPNCLGVINPLAKMNASFSARMPKPGNVSFISQSGALCTAVLDFAADLDFGFSKFISIGNKADVDELDLLRYFHEDPKTEVILLYIEELRRGPEFIQAVKEITGGDRPTPVLAIKSGRTSAGAAASASHTGALAGSEAVYDAIFTQCGIIRVNSIEELFDYGVAFAHNRLKLPNSNRVAIVTNAGGPGIVATDMTVSSGLKLAQFGEETLNALRSHLPPTANIHNPVDVIGDAGFDRYQNALSAVIKCENVDGALVILTPQSMTDVEGTAQAIIQIAKRSNKPIFPCFMGIFDVSKGVKLLRDNGIAAYRFPESAAKAFGALYKYAHFVNRPHLASYVFHHQKEKAAELIQQARTRGDKYIGELGGLEILKCYGFNVLSSELATTEEQAAQLADSMGYPVVMKIVSPQILHKSDAGGVLVKLETAEQVKEGFTKIMNNAKAFDAKAELTGVLIQRMAPKGREVILGATRYPIFGPLLMFGYGGIFVEVFQDVSFRLAPVTRNGASKMIHSIKGYKMLTGHRGTPKSDIDSIEKLLVALSDMVMNHPEIKELDINPLLVHDEGKGATVADCRIILTDPDDDVKA